MLSNIRRRLINKSFTLSNNSVRMSTKCKVAVCQLTATNNKENNLRIVKELVNNAVRSNVKMVFLPEASDYIGHDKNEAKALSEPLNGPLMTEYKKLAKDNNIWLAIGVHERIDETSMYNSHVLIDSDGEIRSIYRKIHLFDVSIPEKNILLKESEINLGGALIVPTVDTPAGALALSVCYDLRFPEQSTLQTKLGAQVLTFPSAFTSATGQAHWEILLRARAIENQCYVIAAAQYGRHNSKRISYGQSMIVDPWGRVLAECPKYTKGIEVNESIATAEIDTSLVVKIRKEMPVFLHRRNDIYSLNLIRKEIIAIRDSDSYSFAEKAIPGTQVFYKSKYCYAFTNIKCAVPGHVLVSTLRVAPRLVDLSQEEIADLFQTAILVQRVMEQEYSTDSSNVCVQDGPLAGQTVSHVHVHVLPRKLGDFANTDDVYHKLADQERDNSPQRTPDEMAAEAAKLRRYFA